MATTRSSPDLQRSAPEDQGSPDAPQQGLPEAPQNSRPDKPSQAEQGDASSSPSRKRPDNEEPDLVLEPDLPSDGRDEVGEAMIRKLPQRPELSEPPSQPKDSSTP